MGVTSQTQQLSPLFELNIIVVGFIRLENIKSPRVFSDGFVIISSFDVDESDCPDHIRQLQVMVLFYRLVGLNRLSGCSFALVKNEMLLKLRQTLGPFIIVFGFYHERFPFQGNRTILIDFLHSICKIQAVLDHLFCSLEVLCFNLEFGLLQHLKTILDRVFAFSSS